MELGCPPHQLKQLLFENVMGRLVLRPSLRPIAAWFCTENQQWGQMVRQLVLDCAPSIHLTFGDPAALPVEYRRQILQALAKGATGRSHLWVDSSPDCLAKLAHPTLAKDIAQLVLDSDLAADLRIELLDVVRLGRLTECGFAAVQIAVLNGERSDLRSKAAEAVSALNEKLLTIRLIDAALQLPDLPSLFCSTLVTSFFPVAMSVDQLAALLSKSEPVAGNSIELPYFLKVHLQKVLLPDCAGALLERLVALVQSPPLIVSGKQTVPVSSQFYWVGQIFPAVLAHLFKKPDLSGEEAEAAAEAIRLIGHIREQCRFDREDLGELNKLTLLKPEVRRRYLWKMVEQFRADQKKEPTTSLAIFDHWETVRLVPDDFGWLIEEAKLRPDSIDRLFALRLATEVWDGSGRSVSGWWRLRRTASQDESLADAFGESATTGLLFPLRRFWWQKIYYRNWKWNARQRFQKGVAHVKWIREQLLLLRKLRFLASGKPIGWLVTLSREADEANNSHWAPGKWTDLEKKRGKWVARATQRGCIAAWRRFSPDLPHEKPEPNKTANGVLVGLAGLQLELSGNRQAVAKLSADEAVLATRYAVNELNDYPDWFGDLVENHPESVGRILSECINAEWLFPAVRKETHEVLARLSWSGGFRLSAVVELVTSLLKKGDPSNRAILNYCVTLVTRAPEPPLMVLAEIASTRITIHGRSDNSPFWLSVWLQTDAEAAIAHLEKRLSTWCDPDMLIVDICSILSGEGGTSRPYVENPSYLKVAALRRFLPLVFSHVRMSDDLNHRGEVYSPGPRDDAQRFRHMLLDRLENHEDPASIEALRDLSGEFAMKPIRDWILNIIEKRFAAEADLKPWTPADIREFAANFEIDPKDDRDLFAIALSRFQSLRWDVEESDNSARDELRKDDTEMILRRWLQRRLSERSRGRYAVPQEEEIDLQQRPDLRMQNPKANAVVSIEIKWADSWTLPVLLERLENQLIGQYLRSHNSRYGIYFLGFIGKKQHWEDPISGSRIDFDQVVELVRNRAIELMRSNPKIAGLEIVNINFTSPTKP